MAVLESQQPYSIASAEELEPVCMSTALPTTVLSHRVCSYILMCKCVTVIGSQSHTENRYTVA